MASQAREILGKEIAESVLYIRFISHRVLDVYTSNEN